MRTWHAMSLLPGYRGKPGDPFWFLNLTPGPSRAKRARNASRPVCEQGWGEGLINRFIFVAQYYGSPDCIRLKTDP